MVFILFCIIVFLCTFPFGLIIYGFILAAKGIFWYGVLSIVIGCVYLRLVKPISILMNKDFKIF